MHRQPSGNLDMPKIFLELRQSFLLQLIYVLKASEFRYQLTMQYKFTLVCWICFRVDIRLVSPGSADPDPVGLVGAGTQFSLRSPSK